ncbi:hypothetical protein [Streptomyces mutomycini]|uniref:DUF2637 domain-containing protein n=1 Tax=Streptomyces mutomycini TaxID=284036 RepID=A0ABW0BDT2_9ACTN|nr:hypothetical protein [Streptomyces mutomycini]
MQISTQAQIEQAEKVLRLSWVIVFGVILFSVFTVTPLVEASTPKGWEWSAPILPLVVDVAVVISIRVDAIVSRLGGSTTGWPLALRVLTGGASVALNIGHSVLKGDWVGALVHTAAPMVLIVVAEASLKWRREIAAATTRIEAELREQAENRKREREEREACSRADREAERADREARETAAREAEREARLEAAAEREREREHTARIERETREHEARLAREEREAEAEREALRLSAAADQRREEADRAERERRREEEQQERERKAKEAAQKAERDRKEAEARRPAPAPVSAAVSTPRPAVSATVSTPAHDDGKPTKMSETDARQAVTEAIREGRSQRQVAALTGWSTGWVAKRFQEQEPPQFEMSA